MCSQTQGLSGRDYDYQVTFLEAFRDHGADPASASDNVGDATAIATARLAPELPATATAEAFDSHRRTTDWVEEDEDLVPPRERRREQQVLEEIYLA